jgi:hypothetical protein
MNGPLRAATALVCLNPIASVLTDPSLPGG